MVEAIFYVLRTAVAWRDLPACYGPWNSVYTRWRRWCALGLWQEILSLLAHRGGRQAGSGSDLLLRPGTAT